MSMSDPVKQALIDELDRAFVEFSVMVRELPADLYDLIVPGEDGSIRAILGHVVSAGYGHVRSVAEACGATPAAPRFSDPSSLTDPETFIAALLDVGRYARESLRDVTDHALEHTRFESRWGQVYDGEQMMEHATCHPGRHARQLRRFLDGELGDPLVTSP
jgi:hypothetical protein